TILAQGMAHSLNQNVLRQAREEALLKLRPHDERVQGVGRANDLLLIARALQFAAQKHTDCRRKGAAAEPYVNHLAEVAWLLAEATDGKDAVLVAAGLLHDTIEDAKTTKAELEQQSGSEIAALVIEVTDDKTLLKEERKRLQIERAPNKSPRAKML